VFVCVCVVQSDQKCGTLQCDIMETSDGRVENFLTPSTVFKIWTYNLGAICSVAPQYLTFYSGPDRPDPGLVPDGASCDDGKVQFCNIHSNVRHCGDGPLELGAAIARPLGLGIGLGIGIVPSYGAIAMG